MEVNKSRNRKPRERKHPKRRDPNSHGYSVVKKLIEFGGWYTYAYDQDILPKNIAMYGPTTLVLYDNQYRILSDAIYLISAVRNFYIKHFYSKDFQKKYYNHPEKYSDMILGVRSKKNVKYHEFWQFENPAYYPYGAEEAIHIERYRLERHEKSRLDGVRMAPLKDMEDENGEYIFEGHHCMMIPPEEIKIIHKTKDSIGWIDIPMVGEIKLPTPIPIKPNEKILGLEITKILNENNLIMVGGLIPETILTLTLYCEII